MMTVEEILLAAEPALRAILTPNELERTHLDVLTAKANRSRHQRLSVKTYFSESLCTTRN